MATRKDTSRLRQIGALFNVGAIRELTDGQLLERFATEPGEVAELAFAALVERHGPMVRRVCRAVLGDPHDAQDAFQATFLVLVKKARGLWVRDSLGPWLHQVAVRTARCARSAAARRRRHERRAAEMGKGLGPPEDSARLEWEPMLHAEIERLPEHYRVPIVLCDLEGNTCEEAARRMGRPVGTVKSWRARARDRLRARLLGRGLASVVGLEAALSGEGVRAAVPRPEAEATVHAAVRVVAKDLAPREISAAVSALLKGVLREMFLHRLRTMAATVLALGVVVAGLGAVVRAGAGQTDETGQAARPRSAEPQTVPVGKPVTEEPLDVPPLLARPSPAPPTARPEAHRLWPLSLREAIRLGLANSDAIRVYEVAGKESDQTCLIAPSKPTADAWQFRAKAMTLVRSIEQAYWRLAQRDAQVRAIEKEVKSGEELRTNAGSAFKAGGLTDSDFAEVVARVEQFRLDLVTKTSEQTTAEQELRELLGMRNSDRRQISPVSALVQKEVSFDWDLSRSILFERNPKIAIAGQELKSEGNLSDAALVKILEGFGPSKVKGIPTGNRKTMAPESNQVGARGALDEAVHKSVHELARHFLEVDGNWKQYQTASKFLVSAGLRLEAQRDFYREGRITIDRYLDAVSQFCAAKALVVQYHTEYQLAIVALEETRGTLLEDEGITVVVTPPAAAKPLVPISGGAKQDEANPATSPEEANDATRRTEGAGKTYSFQTTLGLGRRPFTIRGSITLPPAPAKADGDDR